MFVFGLVSVSVWWILYDNFDLFYVGYYYCLGKVNLWE